MPCPSGMIVRNAYTRKNSRITRKIYVPKRCIKAQSQSGKKRVDINAAKLAKLAKIHKSMRKKFGTPSCKYIREGYTRKYRGVNVNVAPGCMNHAKGKPLFILEKGTLGDYHTKLSMKDRHTALLKVLKKIKPLSVYRKLVALYVLNKNKPLGILYKKDADWVKTTQEYINR